MENDESQKMRSVRVSEDSRREAHTPIPARVEQLRLELRTLGAEKKKYEAILSDAEDFKRRETANILNARPSKSEAIRRTTTLESRVRDMKKEPRKQVLALDARIVEIKRRLSTVPDYKEDEGIRLRDKRDAVQVEILDTLRRIERLLATSYGERDAGN
jgi:hypothetical protein